MILLSFSCDHPGVEQMNTRSPSLYIYLLPPPPPPMHTYSSPCTCSASKFTPLGAKQAHDMHTHLEGYRKTLIPYIVHFSVERTELNPETGRARYTHIYGQLLVQHCQWTTTAN